MNQMNVSRLVEFLQHHPDLQGDEIRRNLVSKLVDPTFEAYMNQNLKPFAVKPKEYWRAVIVHWSQKGGTLTSLENILKDAGLKDLAGILEAKLEPGLSKNVCRLVKIFLQDPNLQREEKRKGVVDKLVEATYMEDMETNLESFAISLKEYWKAIIVHWFEAGGELATLKNVLKDVKLNDLAGTLEAKLEPALSKNLEVANHQKLIKERNLSIVEHLDTGNFGSVYKVQDSTNLGNTALKLVSVAKFIEEFGEIGKLKEIKMFFDEQRVLEELQECPYLVSLHNAWFTGVLKALCDDVAFGNSTIKSEALLNAAGESTFLCIQMDYCRMNLDTCMDEYPFIRDLEGIETVVVYGILEGLRVMHSKGIIHRNLNPTIVFIDNVNLKPQVKIGGFGIIKNISIDNNIPSRSATEKTFVSPELERGDSTDAKTDIFSLGLIYLLLLGNWDRHRIKRNLDDARTGVLPNCIHCVEANCFCRIREFSLLRQMLDRHASNRPNAEDALEQINIVRGFYRSGNGRFVE